MFQEEFPLVSVITPSYNQASFVRETIESVLKQDYPNIEHIIIDGGSTDGTIAVLQSFAHLGDRLRYVSEPDGGQSHAINKGLNMAKGQIIGWLNSDDTYLPGAIRTAVEMFRDRPYYAVVYGKANYINESSQVTGSFNVQPFDKERLFETCIICQPAAFIRRDVFVRMGGVDESLKFCMDYDLWIRISNEYPLGYIDEYLANSRLHDACKSITSWADVGLPEIVQTSLKYYQSVSGSWIAEYIRVNGQQGQQWLLQQLKSHTILGSTPSMIKMNRYHDLWVPPRFRMVFTAPPGNPIKRLLISGRHLIPFLSRKRSGRLGITVFINGRRVKKFSLRKGTFVLEIPVRAKRTDYVIDLVSSRKLIPSRAGINADRRALSCTIDQIIPCSAKEDEFIHILKNNPSAAGQWLRWNKSG